MAITAAMVKELREMTGAGMMDCKKALTATEGDMDKASGIPERKRSCNCTEKSKQNRSRRYRNAESCRRFQKSCRCRSKC